MSEIVVDIQDELADPQVLITDIGKGENGTNLYKYSKTVIAYYILFDYYYFWCVFSLLLSILVSSIMRDVVRESSRYKSRRRPTGPHNQYWCDTVRIGYKFA